MFLSVLFVCSISHFLYCITDVLKTSSQYLEVPSSGINEQDDFSMKCHFEDVSVLDDIVYINWYHSNPNAENQLYGHIPYQNGQKKNDWKERDVTGVYHDTYHEVSVKRAVQEDEKLYICEFFVLPNGIVTADALLHVHGKVKIILMNFFNSLLMNIGNENITITIK